MIVLPDYLNTIVASYRGIPINQRQLLRNLYLRDFTVLSERYKKHIQWRFGKIKQIERNTRKKLRIDFDNKYKDASNKSKSLYQALISECALALERSIYWFFNYRHNLETDFIDAAFQSRYYAEFFSIIALARFLGIAITYIPKIAKVKTEVDWTTTSIKVTAQSLGGGGHDEQYNLLKHRLNQFDFIDNDTKIRIKQLEELLLKEDREMTVYNLGPTALVFKHMGIYTFGPNSCFIGGKKGLGIHRYFGDDEISGVRHDKGVGEEYKEYGIPEEVIGANQKEVIRLLKKVGPYTTKFLESLKIDIERVPHIQSHEKTDLLDWLK